ncbi:MAG: hypothetical protein QXK65_01955 [Candidatus Micrarchaeaceae archaeon]
MSSNVGKFTGKEGLKNIGLSNNVVERVLETVGEIKQNLEEGTYSDDDLDNLKDVIDELHGYPLLLDMLVPKHNELDLRPATVSTLLDTIESRVDAVTATTLNESDISTFKEKFLPWLIDALQPFTLIRD